MGGKIKGQNRKNKRMSLRKLYVIKINNLDWVFIVLILIDKNY